ncbi:MAG: hypothetical protein MAG431_02272 [Chloroflexi bacterium]|nr:hypothetical protein [Chloroflexota bacterium]
MLITLVSRARRNHGLEHATMNFLNSRHPGQTFAGHADWHGFWIMGEISTEELSEVVKKALQALRGGKRELAIHTNCGTNLVASGTMAGLAGAIGMMGVGDKPRQKLERIPRVAALATLALMASRPLGPLLQKYVTTTGDPRKLEVVNISRHKRGNVTAHRITTQG